MKIKGLKKAVGDYQRANADGAYSPRYGHLMLDESTGEVWTDEFYSLGHNEWKVYHSDSVVRLDSAMYGEGLEVSMKNVRKYIEKHYAA